MESEQSKTIGAVPHNDTIQENRSTPGENLNNPLVNWGSEWLSIHTATISISLPMFLLHNL